MKKANKYLIFYFLTFVLLSLGCKKETRIIEKKSVEKSPIKSEQRDKIIEGTYILKTCENSKFSINIKNMQKNIVFKICDKTKTISKGIVNIDKTENPITIGLGKIDGMYYGDSIVIQNYGNSMNEYDHFVQCDQKFLTFIKE